MSPLLIALLGVLLIPLFVSTWRASLAGLASQGLLMAWIAHRLDPTMGAAHSWITLADLILVRGLGAPLVLYAVLLAAKAAPRNDVLSPNLLSWTLALGLVLVAFNFSELLVAEAGEQQTLVAVATAGVLLGFLVLASSSGPFSQIVGALRIENAIALFELGGEHHAQPLGLQLGQVAVVVLTIGIYRAHLSKLGMSPATASQAAPGGPSL